MTHTDLADWQLPRGVSRSSWDYAQAQFLADEEDAYFAGHPLLEFDLRVVRQFFREPGRVIDLGSGAGRALLPLLQDGFEGVAVDLSQAMLAALQRKAAASHRTVLCIRANLAEIDCLADGWFDYAMCLFSTLGMIAGDEPRRAFLHHTHRILKPGGLFVLHVHNFWFSVWDHGGARWLTDQLAAWWRGRPAWGDRRYDYRGIRHFDLHLFRRRELQRLLDAAGFDSVAWIPLAPRADRRLPWAACLGGLRASGWIVVCRQRSPHLRPPVKRRQRNDSQETRVPDRALWPLVPCHRQESE